MHADARRRPRGAGPGRERGVAVAAALVFRRRELRRRERRSLGPAAAAAAAADGPRRRRGARRARAARGRPATLGDRDRRGLGRSGAGAHRGPFQRQDRPPPDRAAGARAGRDRGAEGGRAARAAGPGPARRLGLRARDLEHPRGRSVRQRPARAAAQFPDPRGHGPQLDRRSPALARCPRPVRRDPFPRRRHRRCRLAAKLRADPARGPAERDLRRPAAGGRGGGLRAVLRAPAARPGERADRLPGADRDLHGLRQLSVLGRPPDDRAAVRPALGRRGRRSVPAGAPRAWRLDLRPPQRRQRHRPWLAPAADAQHPAQAAFLVEPERRQPHHRLARGDRPWLRRDHRRGSARGGQGAARAVPGRDHRHPSGILQLWRC